MADPRFTVFTPTYNRAHTLPRVYESLRAQTYRDFEWLIVDDGSTDGTRELIARWSREATFPIRYAWQPNSGKPAATNAGLAAACGELFLIADSDDAFVPDALERFIHHWDAIPLTERDGFTGVTGLCCDPEGRIDGAPFPRSPLDSDATEIIYRYKLRGEKWGFHRSSVLRQFPFPTAEGASHVPEDVVWRAVARRYRTRYVNDVLRIYHRDGDDHLTAISPERWARLRVFDAQRLREDHEWIPVAPLIFYRLAANYARFCVIAGEGLRTQVGRLDRPVLRALWAAAVPAGYALALRDRMRRLRAKRRRASPGRSRGPHAAPQP